MDTTHVPHATKKDFQKIFNNFSFFKKGGLRGSKNDFFEKIFPKSKRASKIAYETCATCPKRGFSKKVKILSFFKKRGVKGVKK